MNDQNFTGLKYFPDQRLNIRQIENVDTKSILRGNVRELLGVMNDLAYVDIEHDEFIGGSEEARKLYKLSQYGLQYMIYTVSKLGDNALLLKDYLQIQEDKRKKLLELVASQEEAIHKLRQKKKTYAESERQYKKILKAMNTEGELEELNRRSDSDSGSDDEREPPLHLNLPRKDKKEKKEKKEKKDKKHRDDEEDNEHEDDHQKDKKDKKNKDEKDKKKKESPKIPLSPKEFESNRDVHRPSRKPETPDNQSEETVRFPTQSSNRPQTSYGLNTESSIQLGHSDGRFRVIHPPNNDESNDGESTWKEPTTFRNQEDDSKRKPDYSAENRFNTNTSEIRRKSSGEEEKTDPRKKDSSTAKKKEEVSEEEEDYEDDFELSESYVPDRLGKSQNSNKDMHESQDKKRNPNANFENTISMDFDKEFDKSYLANLDKIVNQNKTNNIQVPVKRNY